MNFPRQARLTRPAEFKRVFASPVVSRDRCFRVLARKNTIEISRLGMAVSKRVCRHAVGRNRIKRTIRESFREHRTAIITRSEDRNRAMDIVVLPSVRASTISNKELQASLHQHWSRITKKVSALPPVKGLMIQP
jgi:ribonuclease P protein component